MKKYAQINLETGMIEAISWISGEVTEENLILVDEDFDLTNKKYIDGEWVEYVPEPKPEPAPTDDVWAELDKAYQEGVNSI